MCDMASSAPTSRPTVSVVIATRNRPDLIGEAVACVLALDEPAFEILVVDQSDGDATCRALAGIVDANARIRYLATPSRGLSAARNIGIAATTGEIVCFTDDDCRVGPGWLSSHLAGFDGDTSLGAIFGPVVAPPDFDWSAGMVPTFEPRSVTILRASARRNFHRQGFPMGANMALRRSALDQTGPFDTMFGPGAPFGSADDTDMLYRLLAQGYAVRLDNSAPILHLGGRYFGDGTARQLVFDYCLGMGGFIAKHVRCGDRIMLGFGARWLMSEGRDVLWNVIRCDRPVGVRRLTGYFQGIVRSRRYLVDRRRRLFIAPSLAAPAT
jgi:glycosyltransferase involved in cell wall biosynthesis